MIKNISITYILLVAFLSIFAYFFIPDKSSNANQMHLSIHSESPGFEVDILLIDNTTNYKQNLIQKLFFGNKNPSLEIPLQNYVFIDDIFYFYQSNEGQNDLGRHFFVKLYLRS